MNECSKCRHRNALLLSSVKKNGYHVQHNQSTSSESVNLAASAEPEDLDQGNFIHTADETEPTLTKGRKPIDHQGNSVAELQLKFII